MDYPEPDVFSTDESDTEGKPEPESEPPQPQHAEIVWHSTAPNTQNFPSLEPQSTNICTYTHVLTTKVDISDEEPEDTNRAADATRAALRAVLMALMQANTPSAQALPSSSPVQVLTQAMQMPVPVTSSPVPAQSLMLPAPVQVATRPPVPVPAPKAPAPVRAAAWPPVPMPEQDDEPPPACTFRETGVCRCRDCKRGKHRRCKPSTPSGPSRSVIAPDVMQDMKHLFGMLCPIVKDDVSKNVPEVRMTTLEAASVLQTPAPITPPSVLRPAVSSNVASPNIS